MGMSKWISFVDCTECASYENEQVDLMSSDLVRSPRIAPLLIRYYPLSNGGLPS